MQKIIIVTEETAVLRRFRRWILMRQILWMELKEFELGHGFVTRTEVLLVLLLGLLPHSVCKTHSAVCAAYDPRPISHQFYQPGDLIIGGIASQAFYFHQDDPYFEEDPTRTLIEEPV